MECWIKFTDMLPPFEKEILCITPNMEKVFVTTGLCADGDTFFQETQGRRSTHYMDIKKIFKYWIIVPGLPED